MLGTAVGVGAPEGAAELVAVTAVAAVLGADAACAASAACAAAAAIAARFLSASGPKLRSHLSKQSYGSRLSVGIVTTCELKLSAMSCQLNGYIATRAFKLSSSSGVHTRTGRR